MTWEMIIEHGPKILGVLASTTVLFAGMKAKRMLNGITLEKVTDFAVKFIEKMSNTPKVLTGFIITLSGIPQIKTLFNQGKAYIETQIDVIESQIMGWQDKLDMDVLDDNQKKRALELITKLEKDKQKLVDMNEKTNI